MDIIAEPEAHLHITCDNQTCALMPEEELGLKVEEGGVGRPRGSGFITVVPGGDLMKELYKLTGSFPSPGQEPLQFKK